MSFDQYSETPASNYITGYFLTGMAPSSVKVAGSDIMADLASRFAALHTTGGSANAQTLTQTRQFGALVAGLEVVCIFGATNTAAMTFTPDGLAAKNIFTNGAAALAGQAASGAIGYLKYDGTQWNLLNPSRVLGSFTGQGVGWAATAPSATMNYAVLQDGTTIYVYLPQFTGTSNATTTTITGMPASIQPTTGFARENYVVDSGAVSTGSISIAAGTNTIAFGKGSNYAAGGFTASGTKTVGASASTSLQLTWQRTP